MSLTSLVVDPWRTAAMVAAYNVSFAAEGLPLLSTGDGIYRALSEITDESVGRLPVMAAGFAEGRRKTHKIEQHDYQIRCVVRVHLACCEADPTAIWDMAEVYCDCIRAVAETELSRTAEWLLFEYLGDDGPGRPFMDIQALPTRLTWVDFVFSVIHDGRTV